MRTFGVLPIACQRNVHGVLTSESGGNQDIDLVQPDELVCGPKNTTSELRLWSCALTLGAISDARAMEDEKILIGSLKSTGTAPQEAF
jgi:hypothetical protein